MRFDLDHSRLNSRRFVERHQFVQPDVGQSNGPALAPVNKTFHGFPGIEQSHSAVVKDVAVLIARILVVSRLKRKWSVDEIQIQIIEPESAETRLECRFHTLGPMIGAPQLRGDKNVFARNPAGSKPRLQRISYLAFIPVSLGTIEVSKTGFQRVSGCSDGYGWVRNQGAEAEGGHLARTMVERNFRQPKIGRFNHS